MDQADRAPAGGDGPALLTPERRRAGACCWPARTRGRAGGSAAHGRPAGRRPQGQVPATWWRPSVPLIAGPGHCAEGESLSTGALGARRLREALEPLARQRGASLAVRVAHDPWAELAWPRAKRPTPCCCWAWTARSPPARCRRCPATWPFCRRAARPAAAHPAARSRRPLRRAGPAHRRGAGRRRRTPRSPSFTPRRRPGWATSCTRASCSTCASCRWSPAGSTSAATWSRPSPTSPTITTCSSWARWPAPGPTTRPSAPWPPGRWTRPASPRWSSAPRGGFPAAAVAPAETAPVDYTISVVVDKWFAENSFHASEFADLDRLLALKREQGLTISLGLPTLNESATIGKVIRTMKQALMEECPLLDEIVVIDSMSTDDTVAIARSTGRARLPAPGHPGRDRRLPGQGRGALEEPGRPQGRPHRLDRHRHRQHPPALRVRRAGPADPQAEPDVREGLLPAPAARRATRWRWARAGA